MLNTKLKATFVACLSIYSCINLINSASVNPIVQVSDGKKISVTPNPINKVGNAYTVNGITYTPQQYSSYDVIALASWYGDKFHGNLTANGEIFDKYELTAAHPTLPLPSFVEVTNLENGKKVIVRVNDRGPFNNGRMLDLSERAADLLGFKDTGTAKVRIKLIDVNDVNKKTSNVLHVNYNENTSSTETINQPEASLETSNQPTTVLAQAKNLNLQSASKEQADIDADLSDMRVVSLEEPNSVKSYVPRGVFVQVGAFSSEADKLKKDVVSLSEVGVVSLQKVDLDGKALLRLRVGPYGSIEDAVKIKNKLSKLGYSDSRIVVEQ